MMLSEISSIWDRHHGWRVEKGRARMDEHVIARDVARKATMRVSGVYVTDPPPVRLVRAQRADRWVCWLPGEVLPRCAKAFRDRLGLDVAVGDVAYYEIARRGRSRGRARFEWWYGPGHDALVVSEITMEVSWVTCNGSDSQ
jgi:hypothetical protein